MDKHEKAFVVMNLRSKRRPVESKTVELEREEGFIWNVPLRAAGLGIDGPPSYLLKKPMWERVDRTIVGSLCTCGLMLRYVRESGEEVCAYCGERTRR